jgi:hypothetical protein
MGHLLGRRQAWLGHQGSVPPAADNRETVTVTLDEVADQLYRLAPAEFIDARDAAVKAARDEGDRELGEQIAALRKPTAVAWLANQLARERPDEIAAFLELGEALREATASLSGDELRDLARQRQQLVSALVTQARRVAGADGPRVSESVLRGLEETLYAALADPAGAGQFSAGRLSSGLQHRGFGGPGDLPAEPAKRRTAKKARKGSSPEEQRRAAERDRLEGELGDAWARARRAAEARDDAADQLATTKTVYGDAASRVGELDKQLRELQKALDDATADKETALESRADAEEQYEAAERAADAARKVVTELQGELDRL